MTTGYADLIDSAASDWNIFPGNSAATNTTNIATALAAITARGGGILGFDAGTYQHNGITLLNRTTLAGAGQQATILHLANGANTHSIINHVSTNGSTDANAQHVGVFNLTIDGNYQNQTTTSHGISFDQNPAWVKASADDDFDANYRLGNLWLINTHDDGIHITSSRAALNAYGMNSLLCRGHAINVDSDCLFVNCNFGSSGLAGVKATGNTFFSNVYSYYSGQVTAASGYGFDLATADGQLLHGCRAQDNTATGFNLSGTTCAILSACVADSNSTSSAGTYPGYDLANSQNNMLRGCQSYDRHSSVTQTHALRLRTGSTSNKIDLSQYAFPGGGTPGAIIQTQDTDSRQNHITLNNERGFLNATFAASYTPNPYNGGEVSMTLTGAITINNPVGATSEIWHPGMRTRYLLLQDATGGRVVTWGGNYKLAGSFTPNTAANKLNIYDFTCTDGTNWYQTGGSTV